MRSLQAVAQMLEKRGFETKKRGINPLLLFAS